VAVLGLTADVTEVFADLVEDVVHGVSLPRQGKPPIAELNAEGNAMRPFDKNAPVRSFFFASFVV
jgi:hypothetical protein